MQLATSQRPHPPPVPPRPSRQVVAEALKRTPRPPCPTRQAPPPPNTRPWRHEDHVTTTTAAAAAVAAAATSQPRVGRTVVYESAVKEQQQQQKQQQLQQQQQQTNGQQARCSSEPRSLHESQRPLASPNGGGNNNNIAGNAAPVAEKTEARGCGGATRAAASERNAAENHQERPNRQQQQPQPQRRRSSGGDDRPGDRENSAAQLSATDAEREEETGKPVGTCFDGGKRDDDDGIGEGRKSRVLERSRIGERDDGTATSPTSENIAGFIEDGIGRPDSRKNADDDGCGERRSASFGKKPDSPREATRTTLATPTKIAGVNNDSAKAVEARRASGELIGRVAAAAGDDVASGAATTTIPSDDCATVVVVDEPERKIAFAEDNDNIHHQDWLEAGIRYSSTKITLPGDDPVAERTAELGRLDGSRDDRDEDGDYDDELRSYANICERIAMSSLQGLPPLPRSLSGFNLSEGRREAAEPPPPPARSSSKTQKNVKSTQPSSSRPSPPGRQLTTLDTQLAILRKEMFGLRQLDLSLLSQLWSLNESIQEFRQLLQEQEDRAPSPSPSSEEGDDNSYGSHPPPPPRRPAPLLHHHRPPRPPRPLRPPASDDSPSSEEYGAV